YVNTDLLNLIQMKLSKIICTIGPSSSDESTLKKMINAGMDVARLNFSHGTHQSHEEVFKRIRNIDSRIAIAIDISGPKIRLGKLEHSYVLERDQQVILTTDDVVGTKDRLPVNYPSLIKEVKQDSFVYINDGFVKLKVIQKENNNLICKIIYGGYVSSRKGVNVPEANLSMRVPTEKDITDIKKACELGADYLFISFVRSSTDLVKVRKIISTCSDRTIGLVSKIEQLTVDPSGTKGALAKAIYTMPDSLFIYQKAVWLASQELGYQVQLESVRPYHTSTVHYGCG
ncbi:unnamed protein product, partial [marine sediment metagenome]